MGTLNLDACGNCLDCKTSPCICKRPELLTHPNGAHRDNEEIPDYSLIPYTSLRRLAKRYTHGKHKYGARNWERGLPIDDTLNRASEHLAKYASGDRSEDHLAAVAWNVFAVMFFEEEEVTWCSQPVCSAS